MNFSHGMSMQLEQNYMIITKEAHKVNAGFLASMETSKKFEEI